jgi:hypothetical protein
MTGYATPQYGSEGFPRFLVASSWRLQNTAILNVLRFDSPKLLRRQLEGTNEMGT